MFFAGGNLESFPPDLLQFQQLCSFVCMLIIELNHRYVMLYLLY
jgi:hypothetical protein